MISADIPHAHGLICVHTVDMYVLSYTSYVVVDIRMYTMNVYAVEPVFKGLTEAH